MISLDCTLRDGGYYNNWDFELDLVVAYLKAMDSLQIDYVEIGFRTLKNDGFKGGFAYSTDQFLNNLDIPIGLINKIGVMINGSEIADKKTQRDCLKRLFNPKSKSPVTLVRIACHIHEFLECLTAAEWLKENGYLVGFNLMQIADCDSNKIAKLAKAANSYPIDVLYFADSMGSLSGAQLKEIIFAFQKGWKGSLGIHTHDNIGLAVSNSLEAVKSGVEWVDSTVTGMGRGPGNAQTEYATIALADYRKNQGNNVKLLKLIQKYFKKMKIKYGWGINPFYYLSGKYGIHPSYIQEMLNDKRYNEEDILSAIDSLKIKGGKKFNIANLETSNQFYSNELKGNWEPRTLIKDKEVLILGSGPGIKKYQSAIEDYIKKKKPYVIALNTQSDVEQNLIDARAASHPIRLLADCKDHIKFQQPLITPFSMLPEIIQKDLYKKKILDFGMTISNQDFEFNKNCCKLPSSLVFAYVLAVANSGLAKQIILAGFDGYNADDPRTEEMEKIIRIYNQNLNSINIKSITPTKYKITTQSIFGLNF
jgi:4-hydroxy 2-oxovalerate aldolase